MFSAPTGRGEVTLVFSLFLCLSVSSPWFIFSSFFLSLYPSFSSLSFPTFPILLFSFLAPPPARLHVHQTSIALLPLCLHGSTVMTGSSSTSLLEMMLRKTALMLLDQQTCDFAWHENRIILQPVRFPSSLLRGIKKKKKATTLFFIFYFWLVSALFMYECYGCFVCRWFYLNSLYFEVLIHLLNVNCQIRLCECVSVCVFLVFCFWDFWEFHIHVYLCVNWWH